MFAKVSLAAAFFLIVGASLAGASESAQPSAISALRSSRSLDGSRSIVVAQDDRSSDSADSDNDSSNASDSDKDDEDDKDSDSADGEQSADNDDQQNASQQAPDSGAGDAGQVPLNAYPRQVNPNQ